MIVLYDLIFNVSNKIEQVSTVYEEISIHDKQYEENVSKRLAKLNDIEEKILVFKKCKLIFEKRKVKNNYELQIN